MSGRPIESDERLAELRQALNVAPSPQFEHRVRARVMNQRVTGRGAPVSCALWLVVASIAGMCVMTTATWVRNAASATPPVPVTTQANPTRSPAPSGVPSAATLVPAHQAIRPATSSPAAADSASAVEFEVLVPPDQAIALRRLLAAMASGRAVVPAGATTADAEAAEILEPEPIGITPLPDITPLGARDAARGRER